VEADGVAGYLARVRSFVRSPARLRVPPPAPTLLDLVELFAAKGGFRLEFKQGTCVLEYTVRVLALICLLGIFQSSGAGCTYGPITCYADYAAPAKVRVLGQCQHHRPAGYAARAMSTSSSTVHSYAMTASCISQAWRTGISACVRDCGQSRDQADPHWLPASTAEQDAIEAPHQK
jgi:hypothetical protein